MTEHVTSTRTLRVPRRGRALVREIAGPPGAPTVVLLHGLGATSALNWSTALEPLGRHFRVVAPDLRGHGNGIRSRSRFTLEDCADDAVALADALGIDRFIAAGYSMGGPITLLARRRHPDRVAGMVLCATAAHFGGSGSDPFPGMAYLSWGLRLMPRLARQQMLATLMRSYHRTQAMDPLFAAEIRRHDPAAVIEATQAVIRFDARPWAARLGGPAASVVTTRDRHVAPARQLELARAVGATVVSLPADHEIALRGGDDTFGRAMASATLGVADAAGLRSRVTA
jgi:3-oxoadipate enol-lactonase